MGHTDTCPNYREAPLCPKCGARTAMHPNGKVRVCDSCDYERPLTTEEKQAFAEFVARNH